MKDAALAGLMKTALAENTTLGRAAAGRESRETGRPAEELYGEMEKTWEAMKESAARGLWNTGPSRGGMTGGEAARLLAYIGSGESYCGGDILFAVAAALGVAAENARMGRIVAAPTAGSSGILPGVLSMLREKRGKSDHDIVWALFTAGAVGAAMEAKATLSGALGGCQAECGAAAAMAVAGAAPGAGARGGGPGGGRRRRGGGGARRRRAGRRGPRNRRQRRRAEPQEPSGAGLRPGGGPGRGALRQAERPLRRPRPRRRRHGPRRDKKRHPGRRGDRGDGGDRAGAARIPERDGEGGPRRDEDGAAHRPAVPGPAALRAAEGLTGPGRRPPGRLPLILFTAFFARGGIWNPRAYTAFTGFFPARRKRDGERAAKGAFLPAGERNHLRKRPNRGTIFW